jgi:Ca-activated chloride channel family protein
MKMLHKLPLAIAALVGIAMIVPARALFPRDPCAAAPVPLTILTSSNKADLMRKIAVDYERRTPKVEDRCISVAIVSKPSGAAIEALVREGGWDTAIDGPRPDVWSPASSAWLGMLELRLEARGAPDIVPDSAPALAVSPQVVAMPAPMAAALGWPGQEIGWSDIVRLATDPAGWGSLGHPEWGRFLLGKTDPRLSTSSLNATVGTYYAATGRSSDLTAGDIDDPGVVRFVQGVESAVVYYAGETSVEFLENLQRADDRGEALDYVSAIILEEKSVWDYNRGNPRADPDRAGRHAPPKVPLVGVYPKEGTLLADHPYAILEASWVDGVRAAAAADFLRFLQSPAEQRRFQDAGFRDHDGRPGPEINPEMGLLPAQPATVLPPPEPSILDRIQRAWAERRKPATVLMVMDVSGSMDGLVAGAGKTTLELAKQAALASLEHFRPEDELGLWAFSSRPAPESPFTELLPVSPIGSGQGGLAAVVGSLKAGGGTDLYPTLRAAVSEARRVAVPERITGVILLSDGRNDGGDAELGALLTELRAAQRDSGVRVFPIAYGRNADRAALEKIAEASGTRLFDASDPASIERVLAEAVRRFSSS